ncbi:Beta-xylosidase [Pontiella desulfatans]|uniref:Beta-xylosidase n=1 Tax=Pontiella desulfatans TaxID=2750659 RepID=A0A6C2TYL2_PONDE|nr:glycosyl hydrolase 53 family protein [Pontiella desulfatans]VGO12544.1 Beta-xylosidase [Pontiella desulfatans]
MRYHWDVSNRISPMRRFNRPVGEKPYICVVRPLGGKSKDGEKLIDEDTYKWDGGNYVYDWAPLKTQIDTVQSGARIFQLMIDNVPWAFQRGMDLKGQQEVETYGNAWPPNDPGAWSLYIQEMLKELIKTYGRERVGQWRFCIGREIGTAGHWRGSMPEFFDHYALTVKAVHSILPEAKVGAHFLWASSNNSYGPDFVKWCKQNNVHYDFVGVSYYPFYNRSNRVDIERVYRLDFAPIKDIPEWNPEATLEIHEFSLIKSMSKQGNSFDNAPKAHSEAFTVMLGKMMYDHNMHHVFRWGTGENKLAEQEFLRMKGNVYYAGSKQGEPLVAGNRIDAVFARDMKNNQFNIMAYNYNADPSTKKAEPVAIATTLPFPPSTRIKTRTAAFGESGLEWSDWKMQRTQSGSGREVSMLELGVGLPSFSFCKIEIQGPEAGRPTRVLTNRADQSNVEVELGDLDDGNLVCYMRGRRYVIPITSLSDDDQLYLKKWAEGK